MGLPTETTSATFHLHASSAASTLLDYDAHMQPPVKGLTTMVNSIYNGNRFEDLWLEQGVGSSAPKH